MTRAAGTVLWRADQTGKTLIAVVHRPGYRDWSLPKGKLEPDETVPACAVRETHEETGFSATLGRWLGEVTYRAGGADKRVGYFAARATTGTFRPGNETDELRWLPPADAAALLDYATDREVVASFTTLPTQTRTVLLVRHAKAGSRDNWSGDDRLRPLSKSGQVQAAAICRLLPLFGVDRLHSAPRVRCTQTVAGCAAALGTKIVDEPMFSEEGYQADPEGATRRLAEIVLAEGIPAIAGQGGAIPALIAEFAGRSGLSLDAIPAKKASVWVLSFAPGTTTLLAADYLASPLPIPG